MSTPSTFPHLFRLDLDDTTFLRMLTPEDAPELFAVIERERKHISRYDSWPARILREGDALSWLSQHLEAHRCDRGVFPGVFVAGELAGMCGLREYHEPSGTAECSYWLAEGNTGRGIVTRALSRFADEFLLHRNFLKLEIRCNQDNRRSIAVASRIGFAHEATMRGSPSEPSRLPVMVHFGLLKEEWASRRLGENGTGKEM